MFVYASVSKILDFENFQVQLAQSPLLSAYAGSISYAVIISELLISSLLGIPKFRIYGLYSSFAMMFAFTFYIYIILNYSSFIPCSCGGILESLSWNEHLIFNVVCIVFAGVAVFFSKSEIGTDNHKIILIIGLKLLGLGVLSLMILLTLFFSSEEIIRKDNNFIRRYPHSPIIQDKIRNLDIDSYYFVGTYENEIYLGNKTSPFHILKISGDLKNLEKISIAPAEEQTYKALEYRISQNSIYGFDGTVPVIFKGEIKPEINMKTISRNDAYFSENLILDSLNFVLRVYNGKLKKSMLALLNLKAKQKLMLKENILSNHNNSWFDNDGKLLYDSKRNEILYMFYYRNQILKMDNNLKVIGEGKTIDSISNSGIEVHQFGDGSIKMNKAPKMVNYTMVAHNGLIFNRSALIGKFEPKDIWKKASVIDVYHTNSFNYWGSFYVHHRSGKSLSQMLVTNQYLYALIGNHLVRYRFTKLLKDEINKVYAEKP